MPGNIFQYVQTDPPTSKGLAQLVIQMIQFQEDNLGKNVSKPPLTRLPVSSFLFLTIKIKESLFKTFISCCS